MRQRFRIALLGVAAGAPMLALALPAQGQLLPTEEQVKFAVNAELVKGHLFSSQELYALGEEALAAIHGAHPDQELWSLLRRPLNRVSPGLADRLSALLEKPAREIDARVPVEQYRATVGALFAAMDEAVSRVVPRAVRESLAFRTRVILELLHNVEGNMPRA